MGTCFGKRRIGIVACAKKNDRAMRLAPLHRCRAALIGLWLRQKRHNARLIADCGAYRRDRLAMIRHRLVSSKVFNLGTAPHIVLTPIKATDAQALDDPVSSVGGSHETETHVGLYC